MNHPFGVDGAELTRLRAGIRVMALRALGDPDAAEEVAQETLARAVGLSRAIPENLGAYVAGIARHVIADVHRSRQRLALRESTDASEILDPSPDALDALCAEDDRRNVRAALDRLDPDDRELLRLCFVEGLASADVARRDGVPPDRIRQRKVRALDRLRRAFHEMNSRHGSPESATINNEWQRSSALPEGSP